MGKSYATLIDELFVVPPEGEGIYKVYLPQTTILQ